MLVSYVNMKLRDNDWSLDNLCDDLGIDRHELCSSLARAGFEYDETARRFV